MFFVDHDGITHVGTRDEYTQTDAPLEFSACGGLFYERKWSDGPATCLECVATLAEVARSKAEVAARVLR